LPDAGRQFHHWGSKIARRMVLNVGLGVERWSSVQLLCWFCIVYLLYGWY